MKLIKSTFHHFIILLVLSSLTITCTKSDSEREAKSPEVFTYDVTRFSESKPWNSEDFINEPGNFQFAIIGDRTGGANATGTFHLAMNQINLLQPEFVINVGDLIEGYPEDEKDLREMWDEADSITGKLEMPFFHTIGNHDVSTAMTKKVWLERFGADYYYFIYKDVLFMVLSSEDDSRPDPPEEIKEGLKIYNRLQTEDPQAAKKMLEEFMTSEAVIAVLGQPVEFPEKQLSWIQKTLDEHKEVRWTFLFMHEPCWENPSESFKSIQKMLASREYSMFGGHLHYYDYDRIDDREYITMGPAGASFHHAGPGNVDHMMWVTMTDNGPELGNIALKGIFDRKGLDTTLFGAYDRKGY